MWSLEQEFPIYTWFFYSQMRYWENESNIDHIIHVAFNEHNMEDWIFEKNQSSRANTTNVSSQERRKHEHHQNIMKATD